MTEQEILKLSPLQTRFVWVDNAGISRGKSAFRGVLEGALANGVGMTVGQQALPMMYDAVIPETGLGAVGEVRLRGDLDSFALLPFAPGHAMVACDMVELSGKPWAHCPRDFLKRQIARVRALGFEVFSSFENEFFLFREDGSPLDTSNYATLDAFETARVVIDDMLEALAAVGLEPEMYYPEAGTGQQEISIAPAKGLAGADRQVLFKTIIKGIAAKHGLRASFAAKPIPTSTGSGCHLHLSLWHDDANAFFDPSDLLWMSRIPTDSRTARTVLPAMMPVPGDAGRSTIFAPSNSHKISCGMVASLRDTETILRRASSPPRRIASETSVALPRPRPTLPFLSPTTTSALNLKRRPPLTTLDERLMKTTFSTSSSPFDPSNPWSESGRRPRPPPPRPPPKPPPPKPPRPPPR